MGRLKSCPYCGRIHTVDVNCTHKPKREKESTTHTKLRTCRRWDKIRRAVRERDNNLCRACLAEHIITIDDLEVHHIIPLIGAPEKAYDFDNLITLCTRHHKLADTGKLCRDTLLKMAKEPPGDEKYPPGVSRGEDDVLPDTTHPHKNAKTFRNEKRRERYRWLDRQNPLKLKVAPLQPERKRCAAR